MPAHPKTLAGILLVIALVAAVPDEHKPLYLALVYSGNRLSQVLDTLRSFSPKDVTYDGDVAHISAAAHARGSKQSYRLFFPASFIPTLIAYARSPSVKQAYGTIQKRLAHGRVSARTIRKWHLNFLIEHGVTESIADFIQGRTPATVGSAHYLNKVKGALSHPLPHARPQHCCYNGRSRLKPCRASR